MHFLSIRQWFIAVMLFVISSTCLGSIQLFAIQPTPEHDKYLIVAQDGESPVQAVVRYKELLRQNPHLNSLVTREQLKQFNFGVGERFELGVKPAVLILANRGYDLSNEKKAAASSAWKNSKKKSEKIMTSTFCLSQVR